MDSGSGIAITSLFYSLIVTLIPSLPCYFYVLCSSYPIALTVVGGSSMKVDFQPPAVDGGSSVNFYRVEYATQVQCSRV